VAGALAGEADLAGAAALTASPGELATRADRIDELAAVSPDIDRFCSASAWAVSAFEAFSPDAVPFVVDAPDGMVALVRHAGAAPDLVTPLEATWGLASPFLGAHPATLVDALWGALPGLARPRAVLALLGLAPGSAAARGVATRFAPRYDVVEGPPTVRVMARLAGGPDGFLARRSPKFRANARRARRVAADAGWRFELHAAPGQADAGDLLARALAVEARSWKADEGILLPPMQTFYARMLPRLAARGCLRALFARRGDEDVGYAFVGVDGGVMRGLQASYDQRFAREAPGVLLHLELIDRACAEGLDTYDLGTDAEYKRRWGEDLFETIALVCRPRR
jgi:CelD/BcsL family acetyltransferase involved in cellulose biosynthesis